MSTFQAWASVKVINEQSEHFDRAGVVLREEGAGLVVRLDATAELPGAVVNFALAELRGL